MKKENGVTLVTVVIMVIIISIIAVTSILSGTGIIKESKEEVSKQNRLVVETMVSKYSAQMATSGFLTPANVTLPGIKNPELDYEYIDESGDTRTEKKNAGEDWYLLLEDELKQIGVTYEDETYLVNYKKNKVISLTNETENIFDLINYYD